jgi:hypothetical protein
MAAMVLYHHRIVNRKLKRTTQTGDDQGKGQREQEERHDG